MFINKKRTCCKSTLLPACHNWICSYKFVPMEKNKLPRTAFVEFYTSIIIFIFYLINHFNNYFKQNLKLAGYFKAKLKILITTVSSSFMWRTPVHRMDVNYMVVLIWKIKNKLTIKVLLLPFLMSFLYSGVEYLICMEL